MRSKVNNNALISYERVDSGWGGEDQIRFQLVIVVNVKTGWLEYDSVEFVFLHTGAFVDSS